MNVTSLVGRRKPPAKDPFFWVGVDVEEQYLYDDAYGPSDVRHPPVNEWEDQVAIEALLVTLGAEQQVGHNVVATQSCSDFRGRGHSDRFLLAVAVAVLIAESDPEFFGRPAEAVCGEFGYEIQYAEKLIRRCRQRGFLPDRKAMAS